MDMLSTLDGYSRKFAPLDNLVNYVIRKVVPNVSARAGCFGSVCYYFDISFDCCCASGCRGVCQQKRWLYHGPMYMNCGDCTETWTYMCTTNNPCEDC